MFRNIFLFSLIIASTTTIASAQEAVVVAIKGKVLVRENAEAQWVNAQVNMPIGMNWGVKTIGNSTCVLAFDKQRKNIVTVKDHTEVKVDSVVPGSIFLGEGRVFALIKNVKNNKNFEIRTPTAVSGARGTGWLTEVIAGETSISCFDDVIYVNSLDESGKVTGEIDLSQGREINVEEKGVSQSDVKDVSQEAMQEWKAFSETVNQFALPDNFMGKPGEAPMNPDQMMQEAKKQMGDSPEKMVEFERMMNEAREKFGPDFEKFLMEGGENSPEFEAFMRDMENKFGNEFGHDDQYGPNGEMPPPRFGPDGEMLASPDGGEWGPGPGGDWGPGPGGEWNQDPNFDAFHDAQNEANQSMIDQNLAACGHYCCPFPQCCDIFHDAQQKNSCLAN